jgi:hypothetical protein
MINFCTGPVVIDPSNLLDIYVEKLGAWERTECGGTRFVLCVKRKVDGIAEIRAVASLVYPPGVAEAINAQVRQFLRGEAVITDDMPDDVMIC